MPESALTASKEKKLPGRPWFESGRHAMISRFILPFCKYLNLINSFVIIHSPLSDGHGSEPRGPPRRSLGWDPSNERPDSPLDTDSIGPTLRIRQRSIPNGRQELEGLNRGLSRRQRK
ncbi:unnamed protein product [Musa textilis]